MHGWYYTISIILRHLNILEANIEALEIRWHLGANPIFDTGSLSNSFIVFNTKTFASLWYLKQQSYGRTS